MIAAVTRVPLVLLAIWILLHAFIPLFFADRWNAAFLIILLSPVYIWVIHILDHKLDLGGIGSLANRRSGGDKVPRVDRNLQPAQTLVITTGFAAILFFSTIRFFSDLQLNWRMEGRSKRVLISSSILLLSACLLNLAQILVLRVLDQDWLDHETKRPLRRCLRVCREISFSFLPPALILLLLLIPLSRGSLWVNLLFGVCLFFYYFGLDRDAVIKRLALEVEAKQREKQAARED